MSQDSFYKLASSIQCELLRRRSGLANHLGGDMPVLAYVHSQQRKIQNLQGRFDILQLRLSGADEATIEHEMDKARDSMAILLRLQSYDLMMEYQKQQGLIDKFRDKPRLILSE